MKIKKAFHLIFFLIALFVAFPAFAIELVNPLSGVQTLPEIACLGVNFLSEVLMPPIAVILILWAGILYMTSAGSAENISRAKNVIISTILGIVILLAAPALVALMVSLAGGGIDSGVCSLSGTVSTITTSFINLINWFAWFVAVVSVGAGLYSGFLYMTSRGNPEQVKKASNVFVFTIIGIAVAILAFSIISIAEIFI